jgi:carbamoyltransferase
MDTLVIGANFLNHDSGIFCVDVRSQRVFGMTTERMTRYKHDRLPPVPVIRELIREWQLDPRAIGRVIVATSLQSQMRHRVSRDLFTETVSWRAALKAKYLKDVVRESLRYSKLGRLGRLRRLLPTTAGRWLLYHWGGRRQIVPFPAMVAHEVSRLFPNASIEVCAFDHHLTHAVSGLVMSEMDDPLLLTLDGYGDGFFSKAFIRDGAGLRKVSASASVVVGDHARRKQLNASVPPHILATGIFDELTLGHFYSIITWLLGFEPISDEGKVEALAAYAKPQNDFLIALHETVRVDEENARLVICPEEAYALYFDISRLEEYVRRLGKEAVAAATQQFLEDCFLGLIEILLERHSKSSIVLSGGCAANVVLNMHVFEELCPNIFIVPAMGDDGTALGACVLALQRLGTADGEFDFVRRFSLPYFGNAHSRPEAERALSRFDGQIEWEDRAIDWPEVSAALLHAGQVGAVYQGRMEWGPRALGNRSILANPCLAETRERINSVVKKRPLFQPFCPTILEEEKDRLFERAYFNRHMTCAFRMREEFWPHLPSAIHVDGTARVQFLGQDDNALLYRVLTEFKRLSGFGVLINTSFNLHGRTIVDTPEDALVDFLDSQMDFLVLDGYLVRRRVDAVSG